MEKKNQTVREYCRTISIEGQCDGWASLGIRLTTKYNY